jgi:hypothetical protein
MAVAMAMAMAMAMAIGLGLGVAVAVLSLVAVTNPALRLRRRLHQAREAAHLAVGDRAELLQDPLANCFGRRSRGPAQGRGNSTQLLTDDAVIFAQVVPARALEVLRSSITAVTTQRSFLGKTKAVPLLQVDVTTDTGPGAVDWLARDLHGWLERLPATATYAHAEDGR